MPCLRGRRRGGTVASVLYLRAKVVFNQLWSIFRVLLRKINLLDFVVSLPDGKRTSRLGPKELRGLSAKFHAHTNARNALVWEREVFQVGDADAKEADA